MSRPKLGQHFLHDPNIVRKIIQLASLGPTETVLEIGTGHGILTKALSAAAKHVTTLELDKKLCSEMGETLNGYSNVKLICTDAMTYPFESLPRPFKVVANLPYYVATPLIFRLFEVRSRIPEMILMLQHEVAEILFQR